eukprot:gnl/MRDRNA2_/MRDRNA2_90301_c0_seq1.p1 gnl/MRDRNA2_/MRDRNA2_90301_c0~~gnl/MRDRNA2_/MRDRNA2_90301_c0_seq1.p1  ORF type:complete len:393 (-),score=107.24 gnl/MRDRNA2_/MRDRNA2_90301_c0_seq1:5-1183(-)
MTSMQLQLFGALVALAVQPLFVVASRSGLGFLGFSEAPRGNMTISGNLTSEASKGNTMSFGNMTKEASKGNITSAQVSGGLHQELERTTITTTTSKPLFPANANLGSVDSDDTALTMKVIDEGMESAMEKFKKANAALAKLTCAELDGKRLEMDKEYESLQTRAMMLRFEAARANARKSLDIKEARIKYEGKQLMDREETLKKSELVRDTRSQNTDAKKAVVDSETAMILHLNVLEQYTLKCGATEKWCEVGDTNLNEKFEKIQKMTQEIDAKFTEAGWLRNEAVAPLATTQTKQAAELRWGEAMQSVGAVWAGRKSMSTGLEVVTAACGLRPPPGVWGQPRKKCNLKPQDPLMQALLRENPKEFERRWKEIIGKKAGVTPDKVVVNIADCT